jgi:hypothetical protein
MPPVICVWIIQFVDNLGTSFPPQFSFLFNFLRLLQLVVNVSTYEQAFISLLLFPLQLFVIMFYGILIIYNPFFGDALSWRER